MCKRIVDGDSASLGTANKVHPSRVEAGDCGSEIADVMERLIGRGRISESPAIVSQSEKVEGKAGYCLAPHAAVGYPCMQHYN
jgi:hypothetical protein